MLTVLLASNPSPQYGFASPVQWLKASLTTA